MKGSITLLFGLMLSYISSSTADYLDEEAQEPYEQCGYCHELDGNPRMTRYPRLAGQHTDYLVKQLEDFRSGKRSGEMQGTAELLSDKNIVIVAEYFNRQAVKLPQLYAQSSQDKRRAKLLYEQGDAKRGLLACSTCHGIQALGKPGIPRLAGQHEQYLLQQLTQFKTGQRNNDADGQMRAMIALLDETEISLLAAYLARIESSDPS